MSKFFPISVVYAVLFAAVLFLAFSIFTASPARPTTSAVSASSVTPFQAAFSALVPGGGQPNGQVFITNATSQFTWKRELLPYTVPAGKELHITDVHFGSKHVVKNVTGTNGDERSSFLVIDNVMTVTEFGPTVSLTVPFVVPSGQTLNVSFINNSPEAQWMNGFITGRLVDVSTASLSPVSIAPLAISLTPPAFLLSP